MTGRPNPKSDSPSSRRRHPMSRRILYVHMSPPTERAGTPSVVMRHLDRLSQSGWAVSYASQAYENDRYPVDREWTSYPIPTRRPWWPPHRPSLPGSPALRRSLVSADLAGRVLSDIPDVILTVLAPSEGVVARNVSLLLRRPLATIAHDLPELWEDVAVDARHQRSVLRQVRSVLERSARVYPVTQALAAAYGPSVAAKSETLIPIPAGGANRSEWREAHRRPHVVLSGTLYPFQRPALVQLATVLGHIGGRITVVTQNDLRPFADLADALGNVTFREAFSTAAQARAFCAAEASAVLVSYAFDAQPWAATSFPSKLVEFVHLGLPVLILAPPHATASAWARENDWTALVETLDGDALTAEIAALATPDGWARRAADSHRAALGPFDPETIHAGFETSLLALTAAS